MGFTIDTDEAKRKSGRDQHSGRIVAEDGKTLYQWDIAIEEPASEKSLEGGTVRELDVWNESGSIMMFDGEWITRPSNEHQAAVLSRLLEWAAD